MKLKMFCFNNTKLSGDSAGSIKYYDYLIIHNTKKTIKILTKSQQASVRKTSGVILVQSKISEKSM